MWGGLGLQGSLGFRYKFLESIRLVDSKFRNDLTVEFDTCLG